jgi:hypothetical protein
MRKQYCKVWLWWTMDQSYPMARHYRAASPPRLKDLPTSQLPPAQPMAQRPSPPAQPVCRLLGKLLSTIQQKKRIYAVLCWAVMGGAVRCSELLMHPREEAHIPSAPFPPAVVVHVSSSTFPNQAFSRASCPNPHA